MAHSSLRVQSFRAALSQHLKREVPVDQFSAFGLSEARLDMRAYSFALFNHPIFKIELLADDFERLVEDLARVLISARADRQIDHALLFGFEVNHHDKISIFQNRTLPGPFHPTGLRLPGQANRQRTLAISANCANASEVVRAVLRTLEREEQEYTAKLDRLRAAIDEGDASGIAEGDPFARVRQALHLPIPG